MEILNLSLLIIAYTFGVATLILQVVCYFKKIEHPITIAFSAAFLLFIMAMTANEVGFMITHKINAILDGLLTLAMALMALTLPINMHLERKVRHAWKNKVSLAIASLLILAFLVTLFTGHGLLVREVIKYYFYFTAVYAMVLIFTAKPTLLIKHREKAERNTSILFFVIVGPVFVLEILSYQIPELSEYIPEGSYSLSVFYIFITSSKFMDDFKRLTLFRPQNSISPHVVARHEITPREAEVMALIVQGKSYSDIADDLNISMPTVKTHISRVYRKMGVSHKVELINVLKSAETCRGFQSHGM